MPNTSATYRMAAAGLSATNRAVNIGLTTSIIGPLTTVAGLQAAILALGTNYEKLRIAQRVNTVIDHVAAAGVLTATNIAAANTVAGMRAIFTAIDSGLSAYHAGEMLGY